ncbi:MAG: MT-A70 family methyltransferase [Alphaproteobacteria bacterium]
MNNFPSGQYGLIYCDPPWSYKMWGDDTGYEKSPDKHYSCMSHDDLLGMRDNVLFATAPDAVCFMWAVWPMLDQAQALMKAWGFTYKTGGAWHKRSKLWTPDCEEPKSAFGTGYIFRSASEPFLIGTVGDPKTNNKSTRNIIEAAVREHSRKPDCVYDMIEGLFDGAYLELFARNERPNWASWGNETGKYSNQIIGGEVCI